MAEYCLSSTGLNRPRNLHYGTISYTVNMMRSHIIYLWSDEARTMESTDFDIRHQ
jgi:hypothetical protein